MGNLILHITFSDGTERDVCIGDFIKQHHHPQYNKYLDPKKFKKFNIENGNVVWGKNWDLIFPIEQLYAGELKGSFIRPALGQHIVFVEENVMPRVVPAKEAFQL